MGVVFRTEDSVFLTTFKICPSVREKLYQPVLTRKDVLSPSVKVIWHTVSFDSQVRHIQEGSSRMGDDQRDYETGSNMKDDTKCISLANDSPVSPLKLCKSLTPIEANITVARCIPFSWVVGQMPISGKVECPFLDLLWDRSLKVRHTVK